MVQNSELAGAPVLFFAHSWQLPPCFVELFLFLLKLHRKGVIGHLVFSVWSLYIMVLLRLVPRTSVLSSHSC
jgi:hypothetical protein